MPESESLRIGLALSGGGFRATLFHLGVIRKLADLGLLTSVKHICSVSGGSILAGHLACKWGSYSKPDSFQEASDELIVFTEEGIRQKLMFSWPTLWLLSFVSKYNPTWKLKGHYDRLYKKKILNSVADAPIFHFLCTSLTNPRQVFCFGKSGCETHPASHPRYGAGSFRVSGAVTASSAFPGMFPPLTITTNDLGAKQADMGAPFVTLSDGGVFDNLGVNSLRDIDKSDQLDFLIISDASGVVDAKYQSAFAREWQYLPRLFDISGQRIYDLDLPSRSPKEIVLSIHSPGSGPLNSEVRSLLRSVRTDLDPFSKDVIRALVCHGQGVAQTSLSAYCNSVGALVPLEKLTRLKQSVAAPKATETWEPYEGTAPGKGNLEQEINAIKESGVRKVYVGRFILGLLPYFLVGCGIIALLLWYFCSMPVSAKSYSVDELSAVINSLWDKDLLSQFSKEYEQRPIEINGVVFNTGDGKMSFQQEKTAGTIQRVVTITVDPKKSLGTGIRKGSNVKVNGWVESVEYPSTQFGAVNMQVKKAQIEPLSGK